uniref:Uncharacterized protein n=1 Tax=Tetranychus urticae TaxID=32264 RepID=T1K7H4_TETUR
MDFSDDFFDVWSAQWLDYVDCPESIDEWIVLKIIPSIVHFQPVSPSQMVLMKSHDVNEPVPINNPNSIEYSSTSLTYYNSTTLNSSYISNLFGPLGSIDIGSFYSNYHAGMVPSSHRPLSLAKDCSKVQEPWIPSVAKKLLASYYSPLSMKSELLTNQVMLDAFESVALQEAVQAFKDIIFTRTHDQSSSSILVRSSGPTES